MENGPQLRIIFLFNMGMFQPAMLVYQRGSNRTFRPRWVPPTFCLEELEAQLAATQRQLKVDPMGWNTGEFIWVLNQK